MISEKHPRSLPGIIKQRCAKCMKKALIMVTCKCEHNYCLTCRVPEVHNCQFDFQAKAKITIREQNPVVASEKLEKL